MKNDRELTIKISGDLLQKIQFVSDSEGRSLNNHMLMLIRNSVDYYERTHDKIKIQPTKNQ